jgi:ribonuclease HI
MGLTETSAVFSFINDDMENSVDVFVDGSSGTYNTNSSNGEYAYGTGWVLAGKDGHLQGYGSIGQINPFTAHTVVLELRAMVAFFTMLTTHYPQFCTKDYAYTIHGDNQHAVQVAMGESSVKTSKREAWLQVHEEYTSLQKLTATMNVTYTWIKGHADSVFNNAADVIARQAYRSWDSTGSFDSLKRRDQIENLLVSRQLITANQFRLNIGEKDFKTLDNFHHLSSSARTSFLTEIQETRTRRKEMWDNSEKVLTTFTRRMVEGNAHLVFSHAYKDTVVHELYQDGGLSIFRAGILAQCKGIEFFRSRNDEEANNAVSIYNNLTVSGDVINQIVKGKELITPGKSSDASKEISRLKALMEGINIRSVSNDKEIMDSLVKKSQEYLESFIAAEASGNRTH